MKVSCLSLYICCNPNKKGGMTAAPALIRAMTLLTNNSLNVHMNECCIKEQITLINAYLCHRYSEIYPCRQFWYECVILDISVVCMSSPQYNGTRWQTLYNTFEKLNSNVSFPEIATWLNLIGDRFMKEAFNYLMHS